VNPFDFTGPAFLCFFTVLATVSIGWLVWARANGERYPVPKSDLSDPYQIAFLRGGEQECVRVAVISLIDRGLITVLEKNTLIAKDGAAGIVRHRLEKVLLGKLAAGKTVDRLFDDWELMAVGKDYEDPLVDLKLLPDDKVKSARIARKLGVAALLAGFAVIKIFVALGRGHTNIGFLVILGFCTTLGVLLYGPRRTTAGDNFLSSLQGLFRSLEAKAASLRPGGATAELTMLAAVFGVAAVPVTASPYAQILFPKAAAANDSGNSFSSFNTSCNSSSCSSGCGGGGGCGGCGGH
jgi:uncharacterized protein (TIGR04222 family)